MFKIEKEQVARIQLDPAQVARHKGTEEFERLCASIKQHGILQPPGVTPDSKACFGTGRILAAGAAEFKEIAVARLDKAMTEGQFKLFQWVENNDRLALSPFLQWQHILAIQKEFPDLSQKELAEKMNLSEGMISRLLSPSKLDPPWHEALKEGKVTLKQTQQAASMAPEARLGLLAMLLYGGVMDEEPGSRPKNGRGGKPEISHIKCPVPGTNASIAISGEGMSLESAVKALDAAHKLAKAALGEGHDAKAWVAVMKSKAVAEKTKRG